MEGSDAALDAANLNTLGAIFVHETIVQELITVSLYRGLQMIRGSYEGRYRPFGLSIRRESSGFLLF